MVDYEDLPAVVDVEAAAKGGPVIYEHFGDNIAYKLTAGEGDIEAALSSADRVLKQRVVHQRLAPIAMEGRGVLARYFPGRRRIDDLVVNANTSSHEDAGGINDRDCRKQVARHYS